MEEKLKSEEERRETRGATLSEEELKARLRNREINREDLSIRERELLDCQS